MPMNMIRKSAIVNGLREAFPESLGSMYTEEDKPVAAELQPEVQVQQEIKQHANQETLDMEPEALEPEPEQELVMEPVSSEGPGF